MGIGSPKATLFSPSSSLFWVEVGEEEGGSIVWPVKGWGSRVYADVLLAKDICSPPVGIVTTGKAT